MTDVFTWVIFFVGYAIAVAGYVLFVSAPVDQARPRSFRYALPTFGTLLALTLWCTPMTTGIGWDFTSFYIAGNLPLRLLYRHDAFVSWGSEHLSRLGVFYYPPYVRPAIFALPLKAFAFLSYWQAYALWVTICIGAYLAALWLLFRSLALPPNLLPVFGVYVPSTFGTISGQDGDIMLLLVVVALLLLAEDRQFAAGCVLAVCTYKFNLMVLVPLLLIANRRWEALGSFAIGGFLLALASVLLAPPSAYIALLRSVHEVTFNFLFGGLRGSLIQLGRPAWFMPITVVGALASVYLMWRLPLREGFCVALIAALLFGTHSSWYDCALLVLPLAILWQCFGLLVKTLVIAIMIYPPAWVIGKGTMHVIAETALLICFAMIVRRRNRAGGAPAQIGATC